MMKLLLGKVSYLTVICSSTFYLIGPQLLSSCNEPEEASAPLITSFSPLEGPVGTTVTITGANFSSTAANNLVKFNGTTASVTSATASTLVVSVPVGASTGKISVTVADRAATSEENFTVSGMLPEIIGFSPSSGPRGTTVTITGKNFSSLLNENVVRFNGAEATVTSTSSTSIAAVVPAGSSSGKITVTVSSNTVTSGSDFQVVVDAVKAGGSDFESAHSVAVDGSRNSLVTGSFQGTVSFGSSTLTSAGSEDIFIAKYNSLSELVWVRQVGGLSTDVGYSIAVDASGNSYVTGTYSGVITLGSTTLSGNFFDVFIAKFSASGDVLWAKGIGSSSSFPEGGTSVKVDGSGNLYVTGSFAGTVSFGSASLVSAGQTDVFVAKYNSNSGDVIWAKRFGGTDSDNGLSVAINGSGEIFFSGTYFGSFTIGSTTLTSAGNFDTFFAKLSSLGDVVWVKSFSGVGDQSLNSIAVDASGNCYVTGYFSSNTTFGSISLNASGNEDLFVARYNNSGDLIWLRGGGTIGDFTNARSIAVDGTGAVYVAGFFGRTLTIGTKTLTSLDNSRDVFVAKYNPMGEVLWAKSGGGVESDGANSVAVDGFGTVNIVGHFRAPGTSTFGTISLANSGSDDAFLWKVGQ